MGIDTEEVLKAAGSKWNFLPIVPGLVGGHCLGVDPYYLTYKAESIGYTPEIILAGRRLNDSMASYVVAQLLEQMKKRSMQIQGARILVMGLTFKENCPDLRNTRIVDIITELENNSCDVDVYDPWANTEDAQNLFKITLTQSLKPDTYDCVILATKHHQFEDMGASFIRNLCRPVHIIYDLKYTLKVDESDLRL
jgi:UDP-N-acetyl-D-galactosamine dehydrogenase